MADWNTDPVVLLEKEINPASWAGLNVLCRISAQSMAGDFRTEFALMNVAEAALKSGGSDHLASVGVTLVGDDLQHCLAAAGHVKHMRLALEDLFGTPDLETRRSDIADAIRNNVQPSIEASLDVFRRVFISMVLDRQEKQAAQANEAITRLDKISKQIFFIAINASVEAARVGDHGLGFAQISTDIRSLSQAAQKATQKLSALTAN